MTAGAREPATAAGLTHVCTCGHEHIPLAHPPFAGPAAALAAPRDVGEGTCRGKSDDRWLCAAHEGGYFRGLYSGGKRCSLAAAPPEQRVGLGVERLAHAIVRLGGFAGHPMSKVWREGSAREVAEAIAAALASPGDAADREVAG